MTDEIRRAAVRLEASHAHISAMEQGGGVSLDRHQERRLLRDCERTAFRALVREATGLDLEYLARMLAI